MRKALTELFSHIGRFGVFRGTRLVWLKSRPSKKLASIASPQTGGHVFVRPGTSDMAIYDQIVLQPYLPRDRGYRTIVDCGSNIGLTVRYLHAAYPDAQIVAVEPDPSNFEMLRLNCRDIGSIHLLQAGLWPTECKLRIARDGLSPSGFRTSVSDGQDGIQAISIPSIMQRFGIDRIGLLKIDIEGSELELFTATDLSWLSRVDAIAIELHDHWRPGCGDAFFKAIHPWNWSYSVHGEMLLCERRTA